MNEVSDVYEDIKKELLPTNLRFDEIWERLAGESGAHLIAAQAASTGRFARTGITARNGISARR